MPRLYHPDLHLVEYPVGEIISHKTNGPPERPWYSFRWRILFWIALPLIRITLVDTIAMLIAGHNSHLKTVPATQSANSTHLSV